LNGAELLGLLRKMAAYLKLIYKRRGALFEEIPMLEQLKPEDRFSIALL
jgi:hypothetical protein